MAAYHVSASKLERQTLRQRLIAGREALPDAERQALCARLNAHLSALLSSLAIDTLGFCWPYRQEPDIVPSVTHWLAAHPGRRAGLPIVPDVPGPLVFRHWYPGAAMQADRFGIPQPVAGLLIEPQALLIPVNGFDAKGYRIGYGGGFFDRTLAVASPPLAVGIGFEMARLDSIAPDAHDRPLDWIVTEAGCIRTTP